MTSIQSDWNQEIVDHFGSDIVKTKEVYVKRMSQDYFWYSPVLKKQLENRYGDCVITPRTEQELTEVITFAVQRRIPIVPRGGATGNYGQIIPLRGGIVLDTTKLNKIIKIESGAGTFQAGVKLGVIERTLRETNQELRFFPSTYMKSTIAGFIAGGTGGIGSIEYGTLWDEGNVLSLTILTMEEVPKKILVNTKEELVKYIHSYGISGIILEARMALAKKTEWVDVLVSFNELEHALLFSGEVANSEIIKKRLVSVCEAPLSSVYPPLTSFTNEKQATVLLQIAPEHTHHIQELAATYEGETSDLFSGYVKEKQLRITDFSWNHVTLWWLKQHSEDTYLQGRFNPVTYLDQVRQLKKRYSDEVLIHFEWIKVGGVVVPSSQPVIRFTTIERLQEIILSFEEFGIKVSNPHTYLLEEGGKDDWIDLICQAKQDNDPFDLLNPGKTNRFVRLLRAGDIHV